MASEDLSILPASSNSGSKSKKDDLHDYICKPVDADSQPGNLGVKEDKLNGKISGVSEVGFGSGEREFFLAFEVDGALVGSSSLQNGVELNATITVADDVKCFISGVRTDNGSGTVQDGSPISKRKSEGSPLRCDEKNDSSTSAVKKARMAFDEKQASVHVLFNSLTRDSKRKLEELLLQWSEWHARHCVLSHDSNQLLESGEETYFPALRVGSDNNSSVSFCMDNQTTNEKSREFIALDSKSIPLYDRGYSLEGGSETLDASRCFNCGSYNHSLKECTKPHDKVAVKYARKQKKSRGNQRSNSRNPTRYYQNSPAGKYDGLIPGVLDAETRKLLGLGDLDPPPWLNRMREIGYPLGYLDPEVDDQPSGITIFGDDKSKEVKENGQTLESDHPEPPRKMSVDFPGINAPIPANADDIRWAAVLPRSALSRNLSHSRVKHSSEPISRGQYHEQSQSRDLVDEGPPDCDPVYSPILSNYSPSTTHIARGNISTPISPSFRMTLPGRAGWRSPLAYERPPPSHSYGPYSPSGGLFSPPASHSYWPHSPPGGLFSPRYYNSPPF